MNNSKNLQRKIKFRIWDKHSQTYLKSLDDKGLVFEYRNVWQHIDWFLKKDNKFIVQQFLNFLDKNGKEMYEGDVIKYPNPNFASDSIEFKIGEFYYEYGNILFDRNCEYDLKSYVTGSNLIDKSKIEVLGNILEHFDRHFDHKTGETLTEKSSNQEKPSSLLSSIVLDEIKNLNNV